MKSKPDFHTYSASIEFIADYRPVLTNSMTAMKAIVIHGDGVAIMPPHLVALERRAGLLHCIRLVEAGTTRAPGLSRASGCALSPVAQRFAEIVRACARYPLGAAGGRAKGG